MGKQLLKRNGSPINIPLRYQPMHSGDWYILTGILQKKDDATSSHYVAFMRNILDCNINFIHSNDHAPLETRSFEEVSYDLNCSYMFMYTHKDCLQEARTMLTDMTIEDPRSPARKKNKQEEYSQYQDEPLIDEACKKLIIEYHNNEKKKISSINQT